VALRVISTSVTKARNLKDLLVGTEPIPGLSRILLQWRIMPAGDVYETV
jgi:hypothetical protein